MADTPVLNIIRNGYKHLILGMTLVSDGSGLTDYKVYDAGAAAYAVSQAGQAFTPGIYSRLVGLDYDVQGMAFTLSWDATTDRQFFASGASPESFDWRSFGGMAPKSNDVLFTGANGSILVNTVAPAANATLQLVLYIRKNVPQS